MKEKNEIEIVAIVNGTSWVGLGWRPRKLNATCRNFPLIQKGTASEQLVKASVNHNSESKKEPNAEPEKEPGIHWIEQKWMYFFGHYQLVEEHSVLTLSLKFINFKVPEKGSKPPKAEPNAEPESGLFH